LKASIKPAAAMMVASALHENKWESRRPDGEGGIVVIRKFSLGRRRGALFAFCDFPIDD
jgi:hypothetical protein